MGKSALVHELGRQANVRPGFVWGKFAELQGDVPYGPIVEAFRGLLRRLLGETGPLEDSWRTRLRQALGRNARVVSDVIPELEALLGGAPPVAPLGPLESESRFHLTFRALVGALAAGLRPLTLFLDDLQWADSASLRLLEALAAPARGQPHLLLVVAFRGSAADLRRRRVTLGPAEPGPSPRSSSCARSSCAALTALVGDGLRAPAERHPAPGRAGAAQDRGQRLLRGPLPAPPAPLGAAGASTGAAAAGLGPAGHRAAGRHRQRGRADAGGHPRPARARRSGCCEVAACVRGRVDLWLLARLVAGRQEEIGADLWGAIREGLLVPDQAGLALPRRRRGGA